MGKTPTQAAIKYLKGLGYAVGIVEHWNSWAKIRQDLFGFIDLIAVSPSGVVLYAQVTSASNMSARIKKIKSITNGVPQALANLNGPTTRLLVMGYKKRNKAKNKPAEILITDMKDLLDYPTIEVSEKFCLI